MGNDFFQRVYQLVRQIPYGKVTTYGALARALGSAQSSRAVGYALNASHGLADVPAHRVVNRVGQLTGKHHFAGSNLMRDLLVSEGVEVIGNQVQNFADYLWIPPVNEQ